MSVTTNRSGGSLLPLLAATTNGVLVGAAMVATRVVVDQAGPASIALLRYALGFLCLVPALALARGFRIERRDVLPIALLGIGQFGVLIALLNFGLQYVPSARAALIFTTFPLLTMLIGAALGHEPLTLPKTTGVVCTILGVAVALSDKLAQGESGVTSWIGEAAVLLSALTGALCSVLSRPYLGRNPTLSVSALAMLASVVFLAGLAGGEGFFAAPLRFTHAGWWAIAFIGLASGVGYFVWLWALKRLTPTRLTMFLSLSPITAAGLGAALLGEPISPLLLAGVVLVAAGLWLAHRGAET